MTDPLNDKVGKLKNTPLDPLSYELSANPIFWKGKAYELKRSAIVLADKFFNDCQDLRRYISDHEATGDSNVQLNYGSTLSQFMLLAGFALENLFKGLIIFKEPNLVSSGQIQGILRSHDLLALASRSDLILSAEEKRFCILASSATISWGRYPISNSSSTAIGSVSVSGSAVEIFDVLFNRIDGLFEERFHSRTRNTPTEN